MVLQETAVAARWMAQRGGEEDDDGVASDGQGCARELISKPALPAGGEEKAARRPDLLAVGTGEAGACRSGRRRPLAHAARSGRESSCLRLCPDALFLTVEAKNRFGARPSWSPFLNFLKINIKKFQKKSKKNIWMLSATYTMSVQNLNTKYLVV
jgi:hypothetical protein